MRARPFVRREGTGFSVRFVGQQRDVLDEALTWLANRQEGEPCVTLWAGCDKERLLQLSDTLRKSERTVLSPEELHILHAALLSIHSMFTSEESFHEQLGFYRENVYELANGLVMAVRDATVADAQA